MTASPPEDHHGRCDHQCYVDQTTAALERIAGGLRHVRGRRKASRALRRNPSYFVVAGIALDREISRLRTLSVFADGPLARREPELRVRRARRRPNRLGFAVPSEFRLSVTAYPGIRVGDVLEVLLHELVHLHVGRAAEAHAWHGRVFKGTLAQAMAEGYRITELRPSGSLHGTYAEAIERTRLCDGQLAIPLDA